MKLYKDSNDQVWGFEEDGSQDHLITSTMQPYSPPDTPPAPVVPVAVSMRQARLAMLGAGILGTVEAAIEAAGAAAKIEWEFAQEIRRDWPLVEQVIVATGMDPQQVDQLFIVASTL